MKIKICKYFEGETISLCLKNGMRIMKEILSTFINEQIVSFWTKGMKEINEEVEDLECKDL